MRNIAYLSIDEHARNVKPLTTVTMESFLIRN